MTMLAFSPSMKGGVNSSILLLPLSLTQRFPEESKASPVGEVRQEGLIEVVSEHTSDEIVKLSFPKTMLAASPVDRGALNSKTRLFAISATHKSPDESKAMPVGVESPVGLVLELLEVKLVWPITIDAFCPLAKAYVRGTTKIPEITKMETIPKLAIRMPSFFLSNVF